MNKIYCGDNLQIMHNMEDESVDLIYLDPPFFSNRNYEIIWGDNAEKRSFEDRWEGGIMVYINWMAERLQEIHRILKPTGSIYLHCDWHASHYLKVEMDKIFGYGNFQNEIIWYYTKMGIASTSFLKNHDSIFFYTKSNKNEFNPLYSLETSALYDRLKHIVNDEGTIKYKDTKTVKQQLLDSYIKTAINKKGMPLEDDDIILDFTTPKQKNKKIDDVWYIPIIKGNSKERLGYPTQKPEALLERIIKASSNPGDIVFDPFCGCGTSAAVAQNLDRKFIGIDISPIACKLISKRVNYPISDIIGLPRTVEEIKKMEPHEFQNWVCDKLLAKNTSPNVKKASGGDGGIDGIIQSPVLNPKYHRVPIQVKQSEGVGVNTIKNFFATMHDLKKEIGLVIALSFGSGAKEQVAKYKHEGSVKIYLLTVEDIIDKTFNEIISNLKD